MRFFWIFLGLFVLVAMVGEEGTGGIVRREPGVNGQWRYSIGSETVNVPKYPEKLFHHGNCYYILGDELMHEFPVNETCQ